MLSLGKKRILICLFCFLLIGALLCLQILPKKNIAVLSSDQRDSSWNNQAAAKYLLASPLNFTGLSAQSAVLIDAESGCILYEHQADLPLPMASTTKIMTALCALDLADIDDVITVDKKAVGIEGSSIYLKEGEQLTLLDLLYALLLASANDAAAAIAIGTAGSVEKFAAYMNEKAAQLQLSNTSFENPHGLHEEQHYTTAHDLALIARQLLCHPILKTIVSTPKIHLPSTNQSPARVLVNHNKLLRTYEGAIGVKTGFTKRSGRCLVSAAERQGLTLIAVTLNAPDDWQDHTRLLDAGFEAYESRLLCASEGFSQPIPIINGREDYVLVHNRNEASITLPRTNIAIDCHVELPRFLYAGISAGESVGRLVYTGDIDGDGQKEVLAVVDLCAMYSVPKQENRSLWKRLLSK